MKFHIQIFLIIVLSINFGCNSEGSDAMDNGTNTLSISEPLTGSFVADAHPTSGTSDVNKEHTKLSFKSFKTDAGPKLLVYLSTSVNSTDFVNLGELKGISGDYDYTIPANTDLNKYKIVVIWCVDFSVSFGHAELKKV